MLYKLSIHYTKISSHGLINKHKQFNFELLDQAHFLTKYFVNTIHVNSKTLGVLFTANHRTSVPRCEPEILGHFLPHTHQNMIYCINQHQRCPNSPCTVTDCPKRLQQFSHFGSKFWNRSNGRSRPQTNRIINKVLKSRVKQVG